MEFKKIVQMGEGFGSGYLAGTLDVKYAGQEKLGMSYGTLVGAGAALVAIFGSGGISDHAAGVASGISGGKGYQKGANSAASAAPAAPGGGVMGAFGFGNGRRMAQGTRRGPMQSHEVDRGLEMLAALP